MTDQVENLGTAELERLLQVMKASGFKRRAPETLPIEVASREQALPLSFAQRRLWFLARMGGVSQAYHIPAGLRLEGKLDRIALKRSLDALVARHEALRTTFATEQDEPIQLIAHEDSGFQLLEHDLRSHPDAETELEQLAADEAMATFDLETGPLIRGRLIALEAEVHVLLITQHHIVSDGWSIAILVRELMELYGAHTEGRAPRLPTLRIQYADYAVWQRRWLSSEAQKEKVAYWQAALANAPTLLELPSDRERPAQQDHRGATLDFELDEALTSALKALSQRNGTTLFMTLLGGWAALLARLSTVDEVVIGTPVANRTRAELEPLVGFFVNTLALRLDVSESPTVSELLQRVKSRTLQAQQHQELPFEQVVELVRPPRSLAHSPLFQVMFTWQNHDQSELVLPDLKLAPLSTRYAIAKFDLTLTLRETNDRIVGGLEYATALFDPGTIERHLGYLRNLLVAMAADDRQTVERLPLLTSAERQQLLVEWSATEARGAELCVHELFEAAALRAPEAIALVHESQRLTYRELNARANRLARHLRALGVKAEARVAICVERGMDMLIGVLAILKAGGAYVPLDPAYPAERLAYMVEDSAPVVVLTHREAGERLDRVRDTLSFSAALVDLNADGWRWERESSANLERSVTGLSLEHLAYVIYTSGSTGKPKGVMVEHGNLSRLFSATRGWFRTSSEDVWTLFHSLSFDFSVWEIWGALIHGARLVIVPHAVTRSPAEFYELLCREEVTILNQTPSAFRQLMVAESESREPHSLRFVIFGGEALQTASLRPWYQRARNASTVLVNMYGITETTVHATHRVLTAADAEAGGASPIGRRLPDLRLYLLDRVGEPVPVGVAGEIYIGGAGVARGYLNRPELTVERFLSDRFASSPGARMYKSGDLARCRPDGTLEFLGRNDAQVKIRGFRIELGEIEARLTEHPAIRDAVVLVREDSLGDERLVAYYTEVEERGESAVSADALRTHLATLLPEHMVPAAYVALRTLPLTSNGKLDRRALPAPQRAAYVAGEYEAPVGEPEATIARLWAELLRVERVGRRDHFFELGGHSLLAVTLIERMRRVGLHADVRTLFLAPTLVALAAAVGAQDPSRELEIPANLIPPDCVTITPEMLPLIALSTDEIASIVGTVPGGATNVQDIYPLAPLQRGILFHYLTRQGSDPYLLHCALRFDTRDRLSAYLGALQAVIDRNDVLRTAVLWEGLPEPVQVVWRKAALTKEELSLEPAAGDLVEQLLVHSDAGEHSLDIRRAPLLRALTAHDVESARWLLLLVFHHLVSDHTTLSLVAEEIQAHLEGRVGQLPAPVPFRNFVAQVGLGVSELEHEAFFRAMLGDVDTPTAPFGLLDVRGDGSAISEARCPVPAALAKRVRAAARRLGVSVASLFHVAWARVLARLSGQDEVVFGTVLLGRMQSGREAERVVGMFINTLPLRVRLSEVGVEEAVRSTHAQLAELFHHEHAPLALAQRSSAVPAPLPLFTTLLNYRHSAPVSASSFEHQAGIEFLGAQERSNYPLTFSVDDLGKGFELSAQVTTPIDPERICAYMDCAIERLVDALESTPATAVQSLDVLPAAERLQLLSEWNASGTDYRADLCIHELFEAHAARMPEAVAAEHEGRELSYGELNARANQLARYLRKLGTKPDERVAVCVERGLEMLVGLLAISKAGGAYVPLDPAYPAERLSFMLEDSAPRLLLTAGNALPPILRSRSQLRVLDVETDAKLWSSLPSTNPERSEPGLSPEHLVYVIYTSGSTGRPKGVMVEHRNLVNLVKWHREAFALAAGERASSVASVGFDAAAWEVWSALSAGATLVLPAAEVARDPQALLKWWQEQELAVSFLPTPLAELAFAASVETPKLRTLLTGGDRLRQLPRQSPTFSVINNYGPTETTVVATSGKLQASDRILHMGRPIANARIYLLDADREPVPLGVAGEIYIGGAGVARGYLNQPKLTAERFLRDPFASEAGARMYKSGDLGRYLPDGNIEFLGRNDEQVKIRGYRIELGEIEARLSEHAAVRECVVLAREDSPREQRLVAYYTLASEALSARPGELGETLRAHLSATLPEYMLPAAYVELDELPLTVNGKVDRKALPAPNGTGNSVRDYEPPTGDLEIALARIWTDLLKLERIGRHDHFFELGGHSLLALTLIERLRGLGLEADVRTLFTTPSLAAFAASLSQRARGQDIELPDNLIPPDCVTITPEMLPLIELSADEIGSIVRSVPGGVTNVQDIYPLAPLQQGILFHHLLGNEGDAYLLTGQLGFASRAHLDAYLNVLQTVIDRHDVLRTAVLWENVPEPVQVVWRKASLNVEEVHLDPRDGDIAQQLARRFDPQHYRLDVRHAPLMRAFIAEDSTNQRWVLLLLFHHLAGDHTTLSVIGNEIQAQLQGRAAQLAKPVPFRNFVAQTRRGLSQQEHEAFFRTMLGDVDAPTAAFGLIDVRGDGADIVEARRPLQSVHAQRIRARARTLGVSAASLFHVAWALVLARLSGRRDVVFGTVLFGRMQSGKGADQVVGMFINTLPLRVRLSEMGVEEGVRITHTQLAELVHHEHAPLALAQRSSAVPAPLPLFTTLLNCRHSAPASPDSAEEVPGSQRIQHLGVRERSNYPLTFSVDDLGEGFELSAQVTTPIDPERICAYMDCAIERLVDTLEREPGTAIQSLDVLPAAERLQLLSEWNASGTDYRTDVCIHELFEAHAARMPEAVAAEQAGRALSYGELNARANQLAHYLRRLGVKPDERVAVCVERGLEMLVGLLAISKAGGAYVPLDPAYPAERLGFMLEDSAPRLLLTAGNALPPIVRSRNQLRVLDVESDAELWLSLPSTNPERNALSPEHLVYVIYTSGSTGRPKGVMVEHRNLVNLVNWHRGAFELAAGERASSVASVGFDAAAWEVWSALAAGATLVLPAAEVARDPQALLKWWQEQELAVSFLPTPLAELAFAAGVENPKLRTLLTGGDRLRQLPRQAPTFSVINNYGPTEITVVATSGKLQASDRILHMGRPIANARIYLLDADGEPVPLGVAGEIYIGGAGVARGYLNQPKLTAERFVRDPFASEAGARMYKSGDLGRYLPDGNIEFLGRNDEQVKIRGYRIELGEIEARLSEHAAIRECVVLAREDSPAEQRLVAYYTLASEALSARPGGLSEALRAHLSATLPEYMLPAVYVELDELPLTVNGKVDRKALPAPSGAGNSVRAYEPPTGDLEIALARIWADLLKVERIGRHDHFFELGGQSILATTLLSRLRQQFRVELPLRAVFQSPGLAELAKAVGAALRGESQEREGSTQLDLQSEAHLPKEIRPATRSGDAMAELASGTFLTGVTGFLGSFLLHELLMQTDGTVYCLVRAKNDAEAYRRLHEALARYGILDDASIDRVVALAGDLDRTRFGLSEERFQALADRVGSIYHSAALVSFAPSYQSLKAANVLGTQEILRLACHGILKPVHHISTLAIFPHASPSALRCYQEDEDFDALCHGLSDAYAQSKWVAEKLVRIAGARGVPVSIYRMGRISAHSRTGAWNCDDFGCRMIRASLKSKILPTGNWVVDTIPIDYVSRAIVYLSRRAASRGKTYHLVNPARIEAKDFAEWLRALGYTLRDASPQRWREEITLAAQADPEHPLYPLVPMLLATIERGRAGEAPEPMADPPEFDWSNTFTDLNGSGIVCPAPNREMLRTALARLERIGAIDPPNHVSASNDGVGATASNSGVLL